MIYVPDELKPIPLPGLKGYYASEDGRIFSTRGRHLRELSQNRTKAYLCVKAGDKRRYVHQLVCAAFYGPRPDGYDCCHNNGNPRDNRASNLRWDTRKANVADSIEHGTHYYFAPQEQAYNRKLTEFKAVALKGDLAAGGKSQRQLAKEYGISPAAITYLKQGKTYRDLTPVTEPTPGRRAA
ncbi:MAG TPA: HNH endonuclease signature motif containing protein [Tepidisphaeraceae bacterium]|nr:HNH endonuclease signature motif containing protein [Tepidisphaeraceae bacterium]